MDHSFSSEEKRAQKKAGEDKITRLWSQYKRKYRTDEDCLKELYRIAQRESLLECGNCGNQMEVAGSYKILRCKSCKMTCLLTSGTLFHGARKIKAWLGAIFLMERGVTPTSLRFHKLAKIAQSSALNILRKVRMAIEGNLQEDSEEVPSSLFWLIVCKRSRETPARSHPTEEEKQLVRDELDNPPVNEPASQQPPETEAAKKEAELTGEKKIVFDKLSEEPQSIDDLCKATGLPSPNVAAALTFLELDKLVTSLEGDRYVVKSQETAEKKPSPESHRRDLDHKALTTVELIIQFIFSRFHGSSRKYLQNYVSAHWWHVHRNDWGLGKLIKVCLLTAPITDNDIIAYVTPPHVKI